MLLFGRGNVDSADNHGPVVSVLTWFLTVTAVLWVFARAATKWAVSHKIAFDDYLIFLALVKDTRTPSLSDLTHIRHSASDNAWQCPFRYRTVLDRISQP